MKHRADAMEDKDMRLHDSLDYWAGAQPGTEFAVQGERRLTYREALDAVNRLANAFVTAGLRVGDRAAVLSKNSIEYVLIYFAASKAGVAVVPLNYRLAVPEWTYILNDAQPRILIAAGQYLTAIDSFRSNVETVERFVASDAVGLAGWQNLHEWLSNQPDTPPERLVTEESDAYQMYTSGTTGHPKGAVLTHRAVTANVVQIGHVLQLGSGERSLVVAPLFHAGAVPTIFSCVSRGGCLYIQEDFDPPEVVRALSEERICYAVLVPSMIQACLVGVPDAAERSYDSLRLVYYGASPIAEQTLRSAVEVFQCGFVQSYGMTEATQALTFLSPADHRRGLDEQPKLLLSAGRPAMETEIRIVDNNDAPLPNGVPGEIVARGPQLMRSYWNRPEESAEVLRGGWLHTGDVGSMDDEGYVYVQDRLKDMIVSGGENVYPRVVEDVLFRHPAIADAAVIGVPDERWGEALKAVVVLRTGTTTTEEEIIGFCRGKLGGFELPRSVDFVDTLPRNPSGKVLKRNLREPYWIGRGRHVTGA
jgi:acyl-CoA synthetase (AMP-forming)/AMP-acid ligase II